MLITSVDNVDRQLRQYRPRRKWYRRWVQRSAVALILRQHTHQLEVLMIRRADRDGDPWSGQMAFPGGRRDRTDKHTLHTARRETLEEIGLDTERHTRLIGRLSDIATQPRLGRRMLIITPYVFALEGGEAAPTLATNHEVAETVWVPLNYLNRAENRQRLPWRVLAFPVSLPCYFYRGRQIWGLSLAMLDELLAALNHQ